MRSRATPRGAPARDHRRDYSHFDCDGRVPHGVLSAEAEERKSRSFRAPRIGTPKRRSMRSVCSARPARGSGVGSPGRRIDSRKGVGNSAPRETFRTGCRKARAESRFRWQTKRQPVRGTLSPFEPPPRAAVPVDAPPPVDIQLGITARDPADETTEESIQLDPAHLRSLIGVISDGGESSTPLLARESVPRGRSRPVGVERSAPFQNDWALGLPLYLGFETAHCEKRRFKASPEPRPTPQEGSSCS